MIARRNPPTNPQRPARSPRPQHSAEEKWARRRDMALSILGWSLVIAGVLWLASHIVHTLLMLALAALFAYALAPGVALLHRRLPKWLSVIIVYAVVLAIVAAVFSLLISAIITEVTALATQVTSVLSPNAASANTPLFRALNRFGVSASQIAAARDWATHQLEGAAGAAATIVTGLFSGLLDIVLVTVLSIYLLIDGPRIIAWLRHDLPLSQRTRGEFMLGTFERVAGGYVRGELILCTLIGVLVGVGMQFIGVPFATLLGVLAFFFEFIPFLGPLFSAVACLLVGASLGWVTMIIILVYFIFIHIIEGYVVGPRVLGRSLGLHPAISIVALLVGGEVFGLWGALFAAPIAGIVQVVLSALWMEWRESHPTQFPDEDDQAEEDLPEPALNIFNSPPDAAPTAAAPDDERSDAPGQASKPGAAQRTAQPDASTP